jgi:hypothetical protein
MDIRMTWSELKTVVLTKTLFMQYMDKGSIYDVWAAENGVVYRCKVQKDDPATEDQTDFENNYKASCNQAVTPRSPDGKPYGRTESRPLDCTTVFTGRADSDNNIGDGRLFMWRFDNDDDLIEQNSNYKRKRLEFKFLDPIYLKEGTLFYRDAPMGAYMDVYIVCPAGGYYYSNDGSPRLAAVDTPIAHYIVHQMMYQTNCYGREFRTEACSSQLPSSYKFWIDVTTTPDDVQSMGYVTLVLYRTRSAVLP